MKILIFLILNLNLSNDISNLNKKIKKIKKYILKKLN